MEPGGTGVVGGWGGREGEIGRRSINRQMFKEKEKGKHKRKKETEARGVWDMSSLGPNVPQHLLQCSKPQICQSKVTSSWLTDFM